MQFASFERHLISEEVDLLPDGFQRQSTPLTQAEDAINAKLRKFGLRVSGFGIEDKQKLHYCVSSWYSPAGINLIEKTVVDYFQ